MKPKKILFTQYGPFSHINKEVLKNFKIFFPEYEIEVIDVKSLLKSMHIGQKFKLLFHTLVIIKKLDQLSSQNIQAKIKSTTYFWNKSGSLRLRAMLKSSNLLRKLNIKMGKVGTPKIIGAKFLIGFGKINNQIMLIISIE